jgi:hypothetical protein
MSAKDVAALGDTTRRLPKYKQREIQDIQCSLEHLISVGSQVRRDSERRGQFQENWAEETNPRTGSQQGAESEVCKTVLFAEDVRLYGDMARKTAVGFEKSPWPPHPQKSFRRFSQNDEQWDLEHGDTVNPLAFSMGRLSSLVPCEKDYEKIDGTNLAVATTDISVAPEDVPRALLLRCWQQAVHVAATTVFARPDNILPEVGTFGRINGDKVLGSRESTRGRGGGEKSGSQPTAAGHGQPDDNADETTADPTSAFVSKTRDHGTRGISSQTASRSSSIGQSDPTTGPPVSALYHPGARSLLHVRPGLLPKDNPEPLSFYRATLDRTSKNQDGSMAKCKSLGIGLGVSKSSKYSCPKCKSEISNPKALKDHYYGGNGNGTRRGCCWSWMISSQGSAVDQMLQSHIKTQSDLLLGIIFEKAKNKVETEKGEDQNLDAKRRRLLDWKDVMKFAGDELDASHQTVRKVCPHPVLETLLSKPKATPLLLNDTVLETAKTRLAERYAPGETN